MFSLLLFFSVPVLCLFWSVFGTQVDPFFAEGVSFCRDGGDGSKLASHVERKFEQNTSGGM